MPTVNMITGELQVVKSQLNFADVRSLQDITTNTCISVLTVWKTN